MAYQDKQHDDEVSSADQSMRSSGKDWDDGYRRAGML